MAAMLSFNKNSLKCNERVHCALMNNNVVQTNQAFVFVDGVEGWLAS